MVGAATRDNPSPMLFFLKKKIVDKDAFMLKTNVLLLRYTTP